MKTLKQCEAAIAKYKWTEQEAEKIEVILNQDARATKALLALSMVGDSLLQDVRACSMDNTADIAIAKVLGMRVKKTTEMVFKSGITYITESYNRSNENELIPTRDFSVKDVQALLETGMLEDEKKVSTRKSTARLAVEETGENFKGIMMDDPKITKHVGFMKTAVKSLLEKFVAERHKEVIEFIDRLKSGVDKKVIKTPASFVSIGTDGILVKKGGGSEVILLARPELIEIANKYPMLSRSAGLHQVIKEDEKNADLKVELDKAGVKYNIENDCFGIKMVNIPELESTITMDGHDDDVARVLKWMEGKPSASQTSTSENPL
tara:strand:- start:9457 stop:10422 length:966 start_codon:yes stop_codon:yes gene_type:complete